MISLHGMSALLEHLHEVLSIEERADCHVMSAVGDCHRAQTQTTHLGLGREQETVIHIVEEFQAENKRIVIRFVMVELENNNAGKVVCTLGEQLD